MLVLQEGAWRRYLVVHRYNVGQGSTDVLQAYDLARVFMQTVACSPEMFQKCSACACDTATNGLLMTNREPMTVGQSVLRQNDA